MGHINNKPYKALIDRLNKYQVGAPETKEIFEILNILYTKEEAYVGSKFPLGKATIEELSVKTGIEETHLAQILENMARKGIVVDSAPGDIRFFLLTPTIFGFFEFTFMRVNNELPIKHLAELMNTTLKNEMGSEFFGSQTQMSRTLIYEKNLPSSQVMPYERISELIRNAKHLSVQTCFCRNKARYLEKACNAPLEVCMGIDFAAEFLIRRGFAKKASADELLNILDKTEELGLVHITDNVRDDPAFICHCCGCCCELLSGITKLKLDHAVAPSNFIAQIDHLKCNGCGICAKKCQIHAIDFIKENGKKIALIKQQQCIGCSVCVSACKQKALNMTRRNKSVAIPKNYLLRHIKIATEKGRLRHFLFYALSKLLRGDFSEGYTLD